MLFFSLLVCRCSICIFHFIFFLLFFLSSCSSPLLHTFIPHNTHTQYECTHTSRQFEYLLLNAIAVCAAIRFAYTFLYIVYTYIYNYFFPFFFFLHYFHSVFFMPFSLSVFVSHTAYSMRLKRSTLLGNTNNNNKSYVSDVLFARCWSRALFFASQSTSSHYIFIYINSYKCILYTRVYNEYKHV